MTNVHEKYNTKDHTHLDALHSGSNYPDSGLMAVQISDGRWLLQVDFGVRFVGVPSVLVSDSDIYTEPTLYDNEDKAIRAGFDIMRKEYPELSPDFMNDYLSSEE